MSPRICVVTGTRAEYGILAPLLARLSADPAVELQIVVTGMHLSPRFGLTYREIEADGFAIAERVEMLLSSDSKVGVTKSVGLGVIGFADAFARLSPDLVVLLGDRFEALAAAQAAALAGIPLAHIGGGDVTEGAMDDWIRHSITKMATLHFPMAEEYRARVIRMGEDPARVWRIGAPGLENVRDMQLLSRDELAAEMGMSLAGQYALVTFHPATLEPQPAAEQVAIVLDALSRFPDLALVLTMPNADPDNVAIADAFDAHAAARPERTRAFVSLGRLRYLSALREAAVVVGNSSSGIVEAPSFGVPTVDIGSRQRGRVHAESVIDAPVDAEAIAVALKYALSPEFRELAVRAENPYELPGTAELIDSKLTEWLAGPRAPKTFYDAPAHPDAGGN